MKLHPPCLRTDSFCNSPSRRFQFVIWPVLMMLVVASMAQRAFGQEKLKSVVVIRVTEARVNAARRVVGTINPLRSSTIGSAVDGRVVEFLIEHGNAVKQGQPVARLRTGTLEIELAAAKAEMKLYEHRLAELENGSRVEEIDEARARMLGAKAAMQIASKKFERMKLLIASRAVSAENLDDARERAEFTRYASRAAEALLKRIEAGPRQEQIAQANSELELKKQQVRLIEDRIARHTIVAPFDGFVAAEFTEVGAWVMRGDPIAQVVQLDEVEIEAPVTAELVGKLRRGDTIRVELPQLPGHLLTGSVDRIVPVAESSARTFPVFLRIKNEIRDGTPLLMAGMLARVELPAGRRQTMPLVSKDALVLNESNCSLFVVDLDAASPSAAEDSTGGKLKGAVRKVQVTLGVAAGGKIQIRGPVRAGDLVVALGNERLVHGDRVAIIRVQENPKGISRLRTDRPANSRAQR